MTATRVWQDDARCVRTARRSPDFYSGDDRRVKLECALCPVWEPCLRYGLDDDYGVWGGLNRGERARLRRLSERVAIVPLVDPSHRSDVRRIVAAGLKPERLAMFLRSDEDQLAPHLSKPSDL